MIERYFFKGAKYSWNPPAAVNPPAQDGAIVPNPVTASNMTFQDLDTYLFEASSQATVNKFRALGLAKNQVIQHDWLCYVLGRTAEITSANDVMTGFMSGCFIAAWNGVGGRKVAHIGTVEHAAKNAPPNSTVKQTFLATMPNNIKAYSPAAAWNPGEIMAIASKYKNPGFGGWFNILSLVTSTNNFFSILLLKQRRDDPLITCGGIKSCAGLGFNMMTNNLA